MKKDFFVQSLSNAVSNLVSAGFDCKSVITVSVNDEVSFRVRWMKKNSLKDSTHLSDVADFGAMHLDDNGKLWIVTVELVHVRYKVPFNARPFLGDSIENLVDTCEEMLDNDNWSDYPEK